MALTKAHNRIIANAAANIRDFGAVGNGSTDDSAAFNSSMSYLSAQGGGTLFIPVGDYNLNNVLTPMYSNITIEGEGYGSLLRNFIGGYTNFVSNITWRNFRIIGYRYVWSNADNLLFENISFENYDPTDPASGSSRFCQIVNTSRVRITNCYIKNCQYALFAGDALTGSTVRVNTNIIVEGCTIENTEAYSYPAGLNIADGTEIILKDNIIRNMAASVGTMGYGIYQGDNTAFSCDRMNITGNIIQDCQYGIKIHAASDLVISDNNIDNTITPLFDAISNFGDLDPVTGSVPENVTISGNTVRGDISWRGWFRNVTITGNSVRNAGRGINTYTSSSTQFLEYLTIDGNTITNSDETGIQLQDTRYATISNNTIVDFNLGDHGSQFQQAGITAYTSTNNIYVYDNIMTNQLATGLGKFGVFFHGVGTKDTARKIAYDNIATNINSPSSVMTTPVAGTWEDAEKIYFSATSAGGTMGTVCVDEGTFGTLSGVTGSGTISTPTLTVSSASDMEVGDYITATGAGTHRIQNISGTTITLWTVLTAGVSGVAVQYKAPTFKNFGTIAT